MSGDRGPKSGCPRIGAQKWASGDRGRFRASWDRDPKSGRLRIGARKVCVLGSSPPKTGAFRPGKLARQDRAARSGCFPLVLPRQLVAPRLRLHGHDRAPLQRARPPRMGALRHLRVPHRPRRRHFGRASVAPPFQRLTLAAVLDHSSGAWRQVDDVSMTFGHVLHGPPAQDGRFERDHLTWTRCRQHLSDSLLAVEVQVWLQNVVRLPPYQLRSRADRCRDG